jgi:hypothetical protein
MAGANPIWGAPRIHGELLKLGFEICKRTVSRLMPNKGTKPTQTWTTFLRNHVGQLVSIDFFTVATIRLQVLYVFIVLAHDRRRIVHFNVTQHPTAVWAAQQIIEAFPEDRAPRFMVRDRDGIYGNSFTSRVEGMGIEQIHIAPVLRENLILEISEHESLFATRWESVTQTLYMAHSVVKRKRPSSLRQHRGDRSFVKPQSARTDGAIRRPPGFE